MLTLITCIPVLNFVNRRVLKSDALTKYSKIYFEIPQKLILLKKLILTNKVPVLRIVKKMYSWNRIITQ